MDRQRMSRARSLVILVFLCLIEESIQIQRCQIKNPCVCETDEGDINLWSLTGEGGKARFQNLQTNLQGGGSVSWNPCKPFTETPESDTNNCVDAAACYILKTEKASLGSQASATCVYNANKQNCELKYSKNSDQVFPTDRVFTVSLECSDESRPKPGIVSVTSGTITNFAMPLSTECACPGKCHGAATKSSKLSNGSILCIILAVLIVVYLSVGMTFNYLQRGARGRELVPNYSLWSQVPYLIKDGFVFTFAKIKDCYSKGYNKI